MRQISYFESLPLNYKGACYHSFTEHHLGTSENLSLTRFVSISPSLSIVLHFILFIVCLLLAVEFVVDFLDGVWRVKKRPLFETEFIVLVKGLIFYFLVLSFFPSFPCSRVSCLFVFVYDKWVSCLVDMQYHQIWWCFNFFFFLGISAWSIGQ